MTNSDSLLFESLNSDDSRNCLHKLVPNTPQPTTANPEGDEDTLKAEDIGPKSTRNKYCVSASFKVEMIMFKRIPEQLV